METNFIQIAIQLDIHYIVIIDKYGEISLNILVL